MSRWLKILLGALVALAALLALNAIAVTNETKSAALNVEGGELVETSSGTLQVLEEGDPQGSPIVLIHGYSASMNWFEELGPLLGRRHRVIRVDALGHGGSDKPGAGYAISDQAHAIAEALAELDVSGATVVGHSMGGTIATALAETSPELASRVVILDQAPDDEYADDLGLAARLAQAPVIGPAIRRLAEIAPDSLVGDQYEQAFAPGYNMASGFENPDQAVDDLREMTYTSFVEAAEAESDYSGLRSLDDRLAAVEVPLLVVFGGEDQIYDAVAAVRPYRDVPGARVVIIAGVGHSPNVESPERTAALIEAFIARGEAAERAARRAQTRREAARAAARKATAQKAAARKAAAPKAAAGKEAAPP